LTGTVTDASGAVVPGAKVLATHTATGLKSSAAVSAEGEFTIPLLPPGRYTVRAEHPGFAPVQVQDVVLETGDRVALQIRLKVGEVKDSVTVEADAGQLQLKTESGERSDVITTSQILDLALNGRNVMDLMKTLPGIVVTDQNAESYSEQGLDQFNINGTRGNQHQMMVDGTSNVIAGANNRMQVTMNPDAIAEVKVLTSNYRAEYGKAGGGSIQYTTRSGTNRFHGGARYFARNDFFNANNFFSNSIGQPRPVYRYNYYGFDVGGPVIVPGSRFNHDRNKLFFFFNQEHYRQVIPDRNASWASGVNFSVRMPTAAERGGDFSRTTDGNGNAVTVRDPLSATPFPGNLIPKARFFNNGQSILNVYPLPNDTTGGARYNYTSNGSSSRPRIENIVRTDYNPSDRVRLSGRFIYSPDQQIWMYGGAASVVLNYPLNGLRQDQTPFNVSVNLTNILSPAMTNEFIFGFSRAYTHVYYNQAGEKATYGLDFPLYFPKAEGADILPTFQFSGVSNQTFPQGTIRPIAGINQNPTFNVVENLTRVSGQHTWKAGIFVQRSVMHSPQNNPTNATISFSNNGSNPLNAGHPYANALLGIYDTYSQADKQLLAKLLYWNIEPYVQDTWKVTRNLTLDYGLRFSWMPPMHDQDLPVSGFSPSLYDPSKAVRLYTAVLVAGTRRAVDPANMPATLTAANTLPTAVIGAIVPGSGNPANGMGQSNTGAIPSGGYESRGVQWGPRIGFAYNVLGRSRTVIRGGYGISYDRSQGNVIGALVNQPPLVQQPTFYYGYLAELSNALGYTAPPGVSGINRHAKIPNVQSFSFGVQRNLGWGTLLDVAYVGSLTRHLMQAINLNSVPYGTAFKASAQDASQYPNGVLPPVQAGLPAVYQQAGLNYRGNLVLPVTFLAPYRGFNAVNYRDSFGTSNYNSLQVAGRRKFSKGLTFGLAYTWAKAMGTADADFGGTNPFNTRAYEYRVLAFDRTHVLVVNYVYALPKLSRPLGGSRVAKLIVDDWQVSGISQRASGLPDEMDMTIQGVSIGPQILGTPSVTPRLYRYGGAKGPSGDLQINPAAYYPPAIGDIGPYPRNYLRRPGFLNHDVSVFKNVPLGRDSARRLQLRLEMFNILNHTEFNNFNMATQLVAPNGATGLNMFASYPNVAITNNLRPAGASAPLGQYFGEYNSARTARVIQLGAKLYF
jgi:hypothetical protein